MPCLNGAKSTDFIENNVPLNPCKGENLYYIAQMNQKWAKNEQNNAHFTSELDFLVFCPIFGDIL